MIEARLRLHSYQNLCYSFENTKVAFQLFITLVHCFEKYGLRTSTRLFQCGHKAETERTI